MVNKLKYYVLILGEDLEDSINKVMNEYPVDVADVCRIFDCTYEDIKEWLRRTINEKES